MTTKIIIIFSFSVIYCLVEVYLNIRNRKNNKIEESKDRGSLAGLFISIGTGYFLSFTAASLKFGRIYHWNLLFAIGFIIIMTGLVIRFYSLATLKKHFTYSVSRIEDHQLVEKGPYRYIRHPGYLGQIVIFSGLALALSNWLSIILMMLPVMAGFLYRIYVEEKFMLEQLGDTYKDYCRRTWRFIPGVF
jgi:protein-S-isoprenylcysteine O-methyltransferase Ste14